MKRKLIFLDIDGTLTVAGQNTPPESAQRAVKRARELGHMVFLCTGRNPDMLAPVLKFGFDGAVSCAGGYVFAGEEVLFDCPMTDSQRDKAMTLLKNEGVFRTIEAKDATFGDEDLSDFLKNAGEGNSELIRWRRALAGKLNIRPMSEYDGRPIYKVVFMCLNNEQLLPAQKALSDEFDFVVQDVKAHNCLNGELINRKFDKGTGVEAVAERFGFDLADTIGFGDSLNDLAMIKKVACSVCMENGSPSIKEISTLICPPAEEDGIEIAFKKLGII